MSSSTSSPRRAGAERCRSFGDAGVSVAKRLAAVLFGIVVLSGVAEASNVSRAAAESCNAKVRRLHAYAANKQPGRTQATRLSEDEINSYLAFHLSSKYHPSLKSLAVSFEEKRVKALVEVDFDRLGKKPGGLLVKLFDLLFSGTHSVMTRGQLITGAGKGHLLLEEAAFDGRTLPKGLVEEIISAVGRKQNPPLDPLQPSRIPHGIQKVEVHAGYVIVHQ